MSDLTPTELAIELKVTRKWVVEHCRTATLPHYRIGNQIRFTPEDVAAIRGSNRAKPAAPDASGLTARSRRTAS